jgi:hypothetical protein
MSRQLTLDFTAQPEPENPFPTASHSFVNVSATVVSNVVAAHYCATDDDLAEWFYRSE